MSKKTIYLTEFDIRRLRGMIQSRMERRDVGRDREYLKDLQKELDRAKIVAPQDIPDNVITMNSRIRLTDMDTGEEEVYTLVFPNDADIDQNKISILAPIGTALIGYQIGDVIEWDVPVGKRRLRIEEILYQPEATGDYHL